MAYYVFLKDKNLKEGSICKITSDLSYLNINQSDYKIIENNLENYNDVLLRKRYPLYYNENNINFIDQINLFDIKEDLNNYVIQVKKTLKLFTDNNLTNALYTPCINYYNYLDKEFDINLINFPLNISLEEYLSLKNINFINPLQIP